ncbi:dihydroxyacetone kinase subunit DhaL [Actinoplanes sp. SE50]|uniref:dihydroxyacetone kinase subunit DhaL n=1 Tax=unclassified Actinoplanes TaxID=2626549 RepID=UPI00023EC31E|nr:MULTISPECIES: dihydroxyacetone kinase subunit DhaL [unclassified Actinoplanes]AEV86376.1 dihydroxyacetone kinase, C-terminal domain protein [Actinoplanes sp. SE50/110]ATO84773.1 dihydroxyacetone kinase subunit DhaL [Actinoplanes sp. SE50]SLM02183.1 dihydroxyacetone kinase subunit L [Actinoplanes sp. SE50/110]
MDATLARDWMRAAAAAVAAETDRLTRLDSAIGDGDHGVNLNRGFAAVVAALDAGAEDTPAAVLTRAGTTLMARVGGASGPLYGSALRAAGKALPDTAAVEATDLVAALHAGLEAVRRLGGAAPGDKTMIDAYAPALAVFERSVAGGADLAGASAEAAEAAAAGAAATVPLRARKGRASYLGERSIGHQDPGATSTSLIFQALAAVS